MASFDKIHFRLFSLLMAILSIFALAWLGLTAYRFYMAPSPDPESSTFAPQTVGPRLSNLLDYLIITRNNPFDPASREGQSAVPFLLPQKTEPAATLHRPDLVLLGTVVSGESSFSVIRTGGKAEIFRLNEEVPNVGKVERIRRRQVVLREAGGAPVLLEIVSSPLPDTPPPVFPGYAQRKPEIRHPGITPLGENSWRISRQEVERVRAEFSQIFQETFAGPFEKDVASGVIIRRLNPFSVLRQLGLRPGDVIRDVNGIVIDSPQKAGQLFSDARQITVGLTRRGQKLTIECEVE